MRRTAGSLGSGNCGNIPACRTICCGPQYLSCRVFGNPGQEVAAIVPRTQRYFPPRRIGDENRLYSRTPYLACIGLLSHAGTMQVPNLRQQALPLKCAAVSDPQTASSFLASTLFHSYATPWSQASFSLGNKEGEDGSVRQQCRIEALRPATCLPPGLGVQWLHSQLPRNRLAHVGTTSWQALR